MSASIITPESFNAAQLSVSPIKVNEKTGAKSCYLNYSGGKVVVQTAIELRAPYGLNTYIGPNGEKAANPDYSLDVSFDGYDQDGTEINQYYTMMKAIEDYAKAEGYKNRKTWFKGDLSKEVVNAFFNDTVKFPKDKEGNPKPYPPSQKVKLNISGKPEMATKFYNPDGELLTDEPAKMLGKGCTVTCILQCGGIWFAGGKFGITWRATQVVVHKSGDSGISGFAFSFGGSKKGGVAPRATSTGGRDTHAPSNLIDDEEEEASFGAASAVAAVMPAAKTTKAVAEPAPAPADEEDAEGEEVEPIVKPKPTLKKKVVLGKK
jgi:hypothetical protein